MTKPAAPRFLALDVLRGMTICFMIIVNTPGSGAQPFSPLLHARWHGFTPTDLVFPSFLFAVGNAMAFAMAKFNTLPASAVVGKILKRTVIIFLLGFLMYWFPFMQHTANGWEFAPFSHTRVFGVLQRIALCYGIASLMIYFLPKRAVWIISLVFLVGYWLLLYIGGDFTMLGNLGQKIDLWLLGEHHLYHGEGVAFDPEGLLGTFPAVVNVVIGYYAGLFIRNKGNTYETVAKLLLAGAALLCTAYFWDLLFPINKKLWTSPFVLYTCGLDLLLIGALIYIIDILGKKNWTYFFEVFGKNPLFIYLLSEILITVLNLFHIGNIPLTRAINDSLFQKLLPGPIGSFAFAITYMMICWMAGFWMDKNGKYVRV